MQRRQTLRAGKVITEAFTIFRDLGQFIHISFQPYPAHSSQQEGERTACHFYFKDPYLCLITLLLYVIGQELASGSKGAPGRQGNVYLAGWQCTLEIKFCILSACFRLCFILFLIKSKKRRMSVVTLSYFAQLFMLRY